MELEELIKENNELDVDSEKELRVVIKTVMKSQHGRRFVWALLNQCGVFRLSMGVDAQHTAFNEGCRNVGLWIMSYLDSECPESYDLMKKESKEDLKDD